jgi:hypothetical protein
MGGMNKKDSVVQMHYRFLVKDLQTPFEFFFIYSGTPVT